MRNKQIKTPSYWEDEALFGRMIEAKTVNGNKFMMPIKFTDALWAIDLTDKKMKENGLDPLASWKENEERNPLYHDLELVYYELYEEEN